MIRTIAALVLLTLASCSTSPVLTASRPENQPEVPSPSVPVPAIAYTAEPVQEVDAQGIRQHVATQYWTWYTAGEQATMWDGVKDGKPVAGAYSSYDPQVAAGHISAMLANGVNILSYCFLNKAGDSTLWDYDRIDNDRAFREGAMKASNFGSIRFHISYDLASRAMLVHQAENGLQWGRPEGRDVVPGVKFYEPGVHAGPNNFGFPSFDFNLKDANGVYIYDELLLHDFRYFAEEYFNQPNYLTIDGAPVVFVYASWRYVNGGSGGDADAFGRAFLRVRNELYERYGFKLYLAGDFVSYYNKGRIPYLLREGYFSHYDAVTGWNVYDDVYRASFGDWTTLAQYTEVSRRVQEDFLPSVQGVKRSYRNALDAPARAAYGPSSAPVDYLPVLVFSFRRHSKTDGFLPSSTADIEAELSLVRSLRERSVMAEEDAALVYHIAFNQWNEGQIIEPTIPKVNDTYPAGAGTEYLRLMKELLRGGSR
jgi:hypothetical protein